MSLGRTALVIGGTGFLGAAIAHELREKGWRCAVSGRGNKPAPAGFEMIVADHAAPGGLATAFAGRTFDLVVDCACYKPNEADEAVAAFAGRCGHFVFISTDFVYVAHDDLRLPIDEDAPKQTVAPYGVGKLACEAILHRAAADGRLNVTTLRPPHIMGAGKNLGCDFAAMRDGQVLQKLRDGATVLTAEGQLLVQPVWNREVGWICDHIAGNPATFGEVFNCCGPDCVTTRRYYELIAERLGVPFRFTSVSVDELKRTKPDAAPVIRHRVYDLSRLRQIAGYMPRGRIEDAIDETLAWMRR
jgi:nucleoside-diphosphate-sugar epimerase